jgi:UDP-glucose 4-epimerase
LARWRVRSRFLLVAMGSAAAVAAFIFSSAGTAPVRSQGRKPIEVDLSAVDSGYRASKLMGKNVVNEKSEKNQNL